MPGCSGGPVVTNARVYYTTRAAAGASAPGIPHALLGRKVHQRLGRIAPRECGLISRLAVIARSPCDEAIQLSISWRQSGIASAFALRATADKSLRSQ